MYRFLVIPIFLSLFACQNGPRTVKTNADTLIAFMKDEVNPHFHDHRTKEAARLLDSLKFTVEQLDNYAVTCTWLRFKGVQLIMDRQFDSARVYLDRSLAVAQEKDSTKKHMIAAKTQIGDLLKEQNKLDSALHYAREAYYLAKKYVTAGIPIICLRLYEIYQGIGDVQAVRKYLFEGFERSTNPKMRTVFANDIAKFYDETEKPDSAIIFFKAMEQDTVFSNPYFDAVRYENLGVLLTRGSQVEEGLQYQHRALEINRALGYMDAHTMFNMAATYSKLKRYATSNLYLDTAVTMAAEEGDLTTITNSWRRRAQNYRNEGDFKTAYMALDSAFDQYQTEIDSSFAGQARELETQYSVKAKDEEIAALAFANEANQKISQQQQVIIVSMIIGVLLLTALAVLLFRRRQLELKLRETELQQRLLRSQMEPHFIFNTLSVLQSFIRNDEREKSIKYLNKFARLVRISLENARESFVPLKDEIAALDSYLSLQAMRFEGSFGYEIDVYELYEEDELLIPPMLLQPFVENAILHGLKQLDHKGHISVRITRGPHTLHCEIEDNGNGLQPHLQTAEKRSLSTIITQERLSMLARQLKQPATLKVIDKKAEEGNGIRVELEVPFRRKMH